LRPDDFGTTLAIMKVTIFSLALLALTGLNAQDETQHGIVQRIKVHGKGLEGNLEGDSPDRDVAVYLPPSYNSAGNRRYPVVYLLHGFTDDVDKWWGVKAHFVNVPEVADKVLAAGVKEMILVMPNAFTRYQGSLYSNSVTTGDWEDYVAKELVEYVDSHYRTIADRALDGRLRDNSYWNEASRRLFQPLLAQPVLHDGRQHTPKSARRSDPLSSGRCNPGLPQQGCIRFCGGLVTESKESAVLS
jgi:hypothetical protein